jgi:hypothetical protein
MRTVFNNGLAGAAVVMCTSMLGCSTASGGDAGESPTTFVAYASDFAGFRTWASTPGVAPGAPQPAGSADGGVHSGTLTTYINRKPAKGSTSFPVGTIIVKEPDGPAITDRQIFAMVKRGGGFNVDGATDWEWFELRSVDAENVTILWRAIPAGSEAYAANPNLCNDCHTMARANDFVWTAGLKLSSF